MEGGSGGTGQLRHLYSRRRREKKVRARSHRHRLRNAPAPISPETAPRPAPHTRCPGGEPQPGGPHVASPRLAPPPVPAGRRVREALGRELLSGPGHFRGALAVAPPPREDDVDAEEQAAEACCCLAHSPPLNSHPTSGRDGVKRRRRWYFRVALPEPRARPRPHPHPRGHLEDSGLPRRSAPSSSGVFAAENRTRSAIGSSAARIPASPRPGGRCVPHRDLESRDPSPDPDYRGAFPGRPWCSVSLRRRRRRRSRFRRGRWLGSDPGGGRTRAALCGGL